MDNSLPKTIWLAGLGAIARAEREGDEWLAELMAEGEVFEREKKDDLDQALLSMTSKVKQGQSRVKRKIIDIENTFEKKVSSTLAKVGLVSKGELKVLHERLASLEKKLTENEQNNE